ncbi:phosphonate ABC transporter, permease protein PhnE [Prodigiosinella confusarubida]|uniref:Phosphonate ABC transporter, permease protein PhnE n=1 Tax=Serratia sp. (strain ATCC 39006) TaxID=104623 RepID=A0A2I5TMC2_SERS3|nr:phosphonate ABC transporter, permease protein PhnE [Serratia sp. ATCC 39006]AUH01384.1 phosphonate ABC transporter, permease protein PhnE [Serratia sp. ATCC 39006]AUH05705.1 phosphonate ABC transporter, permease protein PhnE [Serratia sp. ATCC 39006]
MKLTNVPQVELSVVKQQHHELFSIQRRYLFRLGLLAVVIVLYYLYFFVFFGISWAQWLQGSGEIGHYFLRMFVWHDFLNWPFGYYLMQILITLAIVFVGTLTATLMALPLSFLAARNVMITPVQRPLAILVRRVLDTLRGIDMAIWGLIFVRAVGMGPLAGVLSIIMQDTGLLGKLYAEGHEAVERSPSRGLTAVGANSLQKHRFGIFTQSFPTLLALSLYQMESNVRSAAVLGFVGAGGVGLVYAENMRLWNWDVVMFITLILVVVVMLMDYLSSRLRQRYIIGLPIALYQEKPFLTGPRQTDSAPPLKKPR